MKSDLLTQELIEQFGNRKHEGRLCFVVDTSSSEVYVVPKDKEHIDYCLELVKGEVRNLEKIIPSHIMYDNVGDYYEVFSVLTGESGMEQGYGVRHSANDLNLAHQRVLDFVHNGNIFVYPNLESKINYEYSFNAQ